MSSLTFIPWIGTMLESIPSYFKSVDRHISIVWLPKLLPEIIQHILSLWTTFVTIWIYFMIQAKSTFKCTKYWNDVSIKMLDFRTVSFCFFSLNANFGFFSSEEILKDEERFLQMFSRLKGRVSRLSDLTSVSSEISFLWQPPNSEVIKSSLCELSEICRPFSTVASKLESLEQPSEDKLKMILQTASKLSGLPKAKFLEKLRVCLTGSEVCCLFQL